MLQIELIDCERVLLQEIADTQFHRKDVAITYAMALRSSDQPDWAKINAAIMARWSRSGLEWIKRQAWSKTHATS